MVGHKLILIWKEVEGGITQTCEYDPSCGRYLVTVQKGNTILTKTFPDGYVSFNPTIEDTHLSIDVAEELVKQLEEVNVSN